MVKLAHTHKRFETTLTVIEGGSGIVRGLLTETDQSQIPAYTFVNPRRILRTDFFTAVKPGMVIRSQAGEVFLVGENGPSEASGNVIWQSWRLFEATGQVTWVRRTRIIDPITKQPKEGPPQNMGLIWVTQEPLDRETPDLKLRVSFEQDRFLSGAKVKPEDTVNGKRVIRADDVLGLKLGVLTA